MTVHRVKFLIIKPTRCINFSNLFLEWNSTCLEQFLFPSSGVFYYTPSNGICHTGLLTAWKQEQDVSSWSCLQAVSKPVWHIPLLCVQWRTLDDGQRNCPKHVEFHSKNKFEKLVHLVGFIIRNIPFSASKYTSNVMQKVWSCEWVELLHKPVSEYNLKRSVNKLSAVTLTLLTMHA